METIVYQIKFKDGREFRVFCANRHQKDRFKHSSLLVQKQGGTITELVKGIHNLTQWESIIINKAIYDDNK